MQYSKTFLFCCVLSISSYLPVAAMPMVVINEVVYDGSGSDADDVFTELFGSPGMSLDGYSLTGTNGSSGAVYRSIDFTNTFMPLDGVLVLATASASGAVLAARDFVANVDWQNGPDSIQLWDASGAIVDALQYGDAGIHNSGEGLPAVDVPAGFSLSRDLFATDTNNNAFDFASVAVPGPGVGPRIANVPEPAPLALMMFGFMSLLFFRLRKNRVGKTGSVRKNRVREQFFLIFRGN